MKRWVPALGLAACVGAVGAQTPDVSFFAEIRPTWTVERGARSLFQWYDFNGRYSLVGIRMTLESGNRVYVGQRLERIDNDGDPDSLDEAYIESRGSWRVGKQYLPFGDRNIVRETVLAARVDTTLVFDAFPISIAGYDAGRGRPRGIAGRIGTNPGLSFAVGDHFGIQGTSYTMFQSPDAAPGRGRGYQTAIALDFESGIRTTFLEGELVFLREGETALDVDRTLSDLRATFTVPGTRWTATIGWARSWEAGDDFFRLEATLPYTDNLSWRPYLRMKGSDFAAAGLSATYRF